MIFMFFLGFLMVLMMCIIFAPPTDVSRRVVETESAHLWLRHCSRSAPLCVRLVPTVPQIGSRLLAAEPRVAAGLATAVATPVPAVAAPEKSNEIELVQPAPRVARPVSGMNSLRRACMRDARQTVQLGLGGLTDQIDYLRDTLLRRRTHRARRLGRE